MKSSYHQLRVTLFCASATPGAGTTAPARFAILILVYIELLVTRPQGQQPQEAEIHMEPTAITRMQPITAGEPSAPTLWRQALAEMLGTALLVAIVVGSGIAASALSPTDVGLQLLQNSLATALGLSVLIVMLGPISGAHFNPVVTLAGWILTRRAPTPFASAHVAPFIAAQLVGGVLGAILANLMFEIPTAISTTTRATPGALLGEVVATAGLVVLIFTLVRAGRGPLVIGPAVGAYIGAAYWFTSSTSFANPAVTLGRVFTETFAGIAPESVLPFVAAQVVGAALGLTLVVALIPRPNAGSGPRRDQTPAA